jgi:L-arabinose isomerase
MKVFADKEIWFVTGSQHLYGIETLKQVEKNSREIAAGLDAQDGIPAPVVFKALVTTPDEVLKTCVEASASNRCIGVITWMHTFSPAKMWIKGLMRLTKPILHLHTQMGRDIPWDEIDMDFMNANQSAHGGREYGHMVSRLRKNREVVVGHWKDPEVIGEISDWVRAAAGWERTNTMKVARFGDNMREVAVTEGDKVAAQIQFGYEVSGFGIGDLAERIDAVNDSEAKALVDSYRSEYQDNSGGDSTRLDAAARIEIGMRGFLTEGGFDAYTDTFEDLHGLAQLPGIASQRLMADGFGFGAEGDWKTAALLHVVKYMSKGQKGGSSFMEDYTYHFDPSNPMVLGAHMLEICPSIAEEGSTPRLEVHPLGIGDKDDPARLVFNSQSGPAINASLVSMGNRFRLILNAVDTVPVPQPMPRLPVAQVMWKPRPSLKVGAAAWIYAGGAHHTVYTQGVSMRTLEMYGRMAGVETLVIDEDTRLREFKNEIRWNDAAYMVNNGNRY